jgi:membrane associated rhomboid family serine protease
MILVPISTDAPIYHRPIGTVSMIVANILVFLATASDLETAIDQYGLHHGVGFTPVEWITSNFIHGGFIHLIGNMIFLWGFGLIVEGKVGWLIFSAIYLLIGVLECLLEQAIFYESTGLSFGASAIIFGLMTISLIWAPVNEITVFYWLFFRFVGVFDISVIMFACLNLMISFGIMFLLFLAEMPMNSEVLHLMGAGLGGIIGFVYLKTKLVDCEGWDVLSVMTGNTPSSEPYLSATYQADRRRRKNMTTAERERPLETNSKVTRTKASPARFDRFLEEKKATAAMAELERIRHRKPEWSPTTEQLLILARGLRKASRMRDSVTIYIEFLNQKPDHSIACLELAEIFVFVQERPSGAKRLLDKCNLNALSKQQEKRHAQALKHAQRMIDDGIIEIDSQQ